MESQTDELSSKGENRLGHDLITKGQSVLSLVVILHGVFACELATTFRNSDFHLVTLILLATVAGSNACTLQSVLMILQIIIDQWHGHAAIKMLPC